MTKPRILVTGATGKTGSAVVAQLLALDYPVRALVRGRDARSTRLERLGAQVVVADLFDFDQLLGALRGATRAYYCPPFHPYMIQSATAFALAAREAKVEAVVGLSQWLASPSHPSLATRQNWLVDGLFSLLPGIAHTVVNPGFFADNTLRLMPFAAHLGVLPTLTGDSRNAPPSNEDIARVVVAALADPDKHAGCSYRPTGPTLLSADDMTAIISRVLKRRVRRFEMPMWMFLRAARIQGVSAFELSGIRYYFEDHKNGAFEFGAPTDDVLRVTGRPPEEFETIARRYAVLPDSSRALNNRLKTLAEFMRVPFSPGYNLNRFDQQLLFPFPPAPHLAMDDEQWKTRHNASASRDISLSVS